MPSRADSARVRLEWTARAAALLLLAWALWRLFVAAPVAVRVVDGAALSGRLGEFIAAEQGMHVLVTGPVAPPMRDAIGAARRAGVPLGWSGDTAAVWSAAAAPEREPGGGVRVMITGSCSGLGTVPCSGNGVVVDTLGAIDTVTLRDGGASAVLSPGRGLRFAAQGASIPLAVTVDSAPWHALVLARAGWEAKFVMAALEERGWTVAARLAVAPGTEVTQGVLPALDPRVLDVVIVLDSVRVGPDAAALAGFVRSGGGVVLAGAGVAMMRGVAPAALSAEATRAPRSGTAVTRESLPLRALTDLRPDAVVLEKRGHLVTVAARAEGKGRVVQLGYGDTWRWRMEGATTAMADHRVFWSRVLASAVGDRVALPAAPEGAPRARLVDAWGPMSAAPAMPRRDSHTRWLWPVIAMLLVAEWASRRTRGTA